MILNLICYNYIFLKLTFFFVDGACTVIRVGPDVDSFGDSERTPNSKVGMNVGMNILCYWYLLPYIMYIGNRYIILCLFITEMQYKIELSLG